MSICSKWSREYGCSCCENQDACNERVIDPLENATDEELEDLDVEPSDAGNAHNHIWREGTPMPAEEKSKDALLSSIKRCGTAGRWLRGEEIAWGAELEAEGKVSLCCGGEAATFIDQSNAGVHTPSEAR